MSRHDASDRRTHDRFEVVGKLWGYLTVSDQLEIRDVSQDGVLALSKSAPPVGSIHAVTAAVSGRVEEVRLRVTHVRDLAGQTSEHLVGFECVDDDRQFWNQIVQDLIGGLDVDG